MININITKPLTPTDEVNEMGYMLAHGFCINCRRPFSFNPNYVPSVRVRGEREPVCLPCMTEANKERVKAGEAPHFIHPDAYEPEECF